MDKNVLSLVLTIGLGVALVACGGSAAPPPAAVGPAEVEPGAVVAPPPAPEAAKPLVADFTSANRINLLGGEFGSWGSSAPAPEGICTEQLVGGQGPDGSQAWRVDYDISMSGSYAGTWMRLNDFDATALKNISFDIRGDNEFSPSLIVELKANGGQRVSRHTLTGVTNEWKRVSIPFTSFAELGEPKPLYELTLVFDAQVCGPKLKGGYLLDNISFD